MDTPRLADVLRDAFAGDDGVTDLSGGGYVPIQVEGVIDGRPFYFRARHDAVTIELKDPTAGEAAWNAELVVPTEYGAGYLADEVVVAVLRAFVLLFRQLHEDAPAYYLAALRERREARVEKQVLGPVLDAMAHQARSSAEGGADCG